MGFLVLTDDEIALLRFTCDLFFVEESPLFYLEAEPIDPADYEASYQALVQKRVIDPAGFRVTDEALNRIAPVTECDARVVHVARGPGGQLEERDYYLLDEIAVSYGRGDTGHVLGVDMDQDELIEHLARRFEPRRAAGDRVDLALSPLEYVALCRLFPAAARGGAAERVGRDLARQRLGEAPRVDVQASASPSRLEVLARRRDGSGSSPPRPARTRGLLGDDAWDASVEALLQKDAVRLEGDDLVLRPALQEALAAIAGAARHTFVRYDFGEDEWLLRETSLLPAAGSLFFLGLDKGDEDLHLRELDGDGLKLALQTAVGPLTRLPETPRPRSFRAVLFGKDDEDEADTELALPIIASHDTVSE